MKTPEERAAHAAYMREYRQKNLDEFRKKEREWAKNKPSRTPEARKAKADEKKAARLAEYERELEGVRPFIALAEVVYKIAKIQRQREFASAYYEKNREERQRISRERMKQERVDHPERVHTREKKARQRKQEKIKAGLAEPRVRKWDTPERKATKAKYYKANKPKYKVYKHERRAREEGAEGSFTPEQIAALLVKQESRCAYCPKSIEGGYHIEHRQPLSRGGSNWIENIALSCAFCNKSKGPKTDAQFVEYLKRRATRVSTN